jgi:pyridoxamine 5'-phosphate oxidase
MTIESNPIERFRQLYHQIFQADKPESSAVNLATASPDGRPSVRVVLLKDFDEHGFVFYTNLESRKAIELKANPYAALCFYWEANHYQVRVEGPVEQVSDEEADSYFATRPRGSQIGAWASLQSSALADRTTLEQQFQQFEKQFEGKQVPRPPFWSGLRVIPERVEFWKREENRLHERILYVREDGGWKMSLLYP